MNISKEIIFLIKDILVFKVLIEYYHKSRFLYGLPAFAEHKSKINKVDKAMLSNIKKLLKLPTKTNNQKLKTALGLSELNLYLTKRLIKIKNKYEKTFGEKSTLYDNIIKINTIMKNIPKLEEINRIIDTKFKENAAELGYHISNNFKYRLKHNIFSWYEDPDFLHFYF